MPEEPVAAASNVETSDDSQLEGDDFPGADEDDDSRWEVFIADDDELDPEPEPGDFWMEMGSAGEPDSEL